MKKTPSIFLHVGDLDTELYDNARIINNATTSEARVKV